MFWPMLAIALGFLGIAVLGVLAIRVFLEVQRLGRQVAHTTERISQAAGDLETAASRPGPNRRVPALSPCRTLREAALNRARGTQSGVCKGIALRLLLRVTIADSAVAGHLSDPPGTALHVASVKKVNSYG